MISTDLCICLSMFMVSSETGEFNCEMRLDARKSICGYQPRKVRLPGDSQRGVSDSGCMRMSQNEVSLDFDLADKKLFQNHAQCLH